MSDESLIVALRAIQNCYGKHGHSDLGVRDRSAYFLHLRATLDRKPDPVLIVHHRSTSILSMNLPAFELLAIDAVGLRIYDFFEDWGVCDRMMHQLQQTGASSQTTLLHNADGHKIVCRLDANLTPHCSEWLILGIKANQPSPCPPQPMS